MTKPKIITQLETVFGNNMLTKLLDEYREIKKEFLKESWSSCISHCALFAELTVAALKILYDTNPIDLNQIHFDNLYKDLTSRQKPNPEDEILLLAVPNAAKTVYTIRSKKKIAHIKFIDPDFLDATLVSSICDWILSQFVLLKCQSSPQETSKFIHSLVERKIPLMEEFDDGSMLVLKHDIAFHYEILLILYKKNMRISKDHFTTIIEIEYRQKLNTAITFLKDKKLIHVNNEGIMITKLGIEKAERIISEQEKSKK